MGRLHDSARDEARERRRRERGGERRGRRGGGRGGVEEEERDLFNNLKNNNEKPAAKLVPGVRQSLQELQGAEHPQEQNPQVNPAAELPGDQKGNHKIEGRILHQNHRRDFRLHSRQGNFLRRHAQLRGVCAQKGKKKEG